MTQLQAQHSVLTCAASAPSGVSEAKSGTVQIRCKLPTDAPTANYTGYIVQTTAYLTPDPIGLEAANGSGSTTSCAVGDGSTNAWCELGNLSIENAQVISLGMGLVWAIAWGFKALRKSIVIPKEES